MPILAHPVEIWARAYTDIRRLMAAATKLLKSREENTRKDRIKNRIESILR
jgi:hypothetical protein